jgi:hypothetical protein
MLQRIRAHCQARIVPGCIRTSSLPLRRTDPPTDASPRRTRVSVPRIYFALLRTSALGATPATVSAGAAPLRRADSGRHGVGQLVRHAAPAQHREGAPVREPPRYATRVVLLPLRRRLHIPRGVQRRAVSAKAE